MPSLTSVPIKEQRSSSKSQAETVMDTQTLGKRSRSHTMEAAQRPPEGDEAQCWVCLDGDDSDPCNPLSRHCACPRLVHRACLARWQLQSMNNAEETCCRFCAHPLPSWSSALLPAAAQHIPEPPVAVMAVVYGERVAKVPVRPGPEGEAEFKATVKTLFGFSHELDFDVSFEVRLPSVPGYSLPAPESVSSIMLRGLQRFDTAATCAQASAVARAMAGKAGVQA